MVIIDQKFFSSLTKIGGGGNVLVGFEASPPRRRFRHPWRTTTSWNADEERWEARVRPGFINGVDPVVRGYRDDGNPRQLAEIPLTDDPWIPLTALRSVPGEGEPLPGFFKQLGVRQPKNDISISEAGGVVIDTTPEDPALPPPRYLMAVDLFAAVARATYNLTVTAVDPAGIVGQIVDYSVAFDTRQLDRVGIRARLQAGTFQPVRPPTLMERLTGAYADEGEDRVLISTVYFLSPESVAGPVDETWEPYVKHSCFWNLMHAARNDPPREAVKPIRFFSGLAAGLGDIVINQNLSLNQDLMDKIGTALQNDDNAGQFWSI